MVELFFFGVGEGSSRKAIESFAPRRFNIMINYASAVRPIPKNVNKLFVDSGGFSFFFKLREYPDPHEKYLEDAVVGEVRCYGVVSASLD